jgi:TRAP-type mannitol/chloroaromatic compound transport system permease small subunit
MNEMPAGVVRTIRTIDAISMWSGRIFGWLIVPLIGTMVYEIAARYLLRPTLWAYDTSYMLYGSMFMLGAAYTLYRGGHIRADFFYRLWPARVQGAVDALFYLLFFFPGVGLFLWAGMDFAWTSWIARERIVASSWMPPIYPLKSILPLAAALLLLQGVSEFLKSVYAVVRGRRLAGADTGSITT